MRMDCTNSVIDNRIAWIDNAKMIAMLFVILGHTSRIIHCPMPEWLNMFILAFNMPLFVVLSGYTQFKALQRLRNLQDLINYIYKLTCRMLVPAIVFTYTLRFIDTFSAGGNFFKMVILETIGLSYCLLYLIRDKYSLCSSLFKIACWIAIPLAMIKSNYWFFNMLWAVSVTMGIAKYLCDCMRIRQWSLFITCVLSIPLAFLMNIFHDKTTDFIAFFWLGILLYRINFFEKIDYWWSIILFFVLGNLSLSHFGIETFNFWDYHPLYYLLRSEISVFMYRILTSSLLCLSLLILIKKLSNSYSNFSKCGTYTLPIYLIHSVFITVFYNSNIHIQLGSLDYMMYALVCTYILCIASLLLVKLSNKYSLTRAFVLGKIVL